MAAIGRLNKLLRPEAKLVRSLASLLSPFNRMLQALQQDGIDGLAAQAAQRLGARARLLVIVLLMAFPALLALVYIAKYAVNISWLDELAIVPLFDKLYDGRLSFGDLFAQANVHRILFPRLVMLGLGVLTHYNTVFESYFSWFLICLIGCVLFVAHIRRFGTAAISLVAFIPVVWLIFALRQSWNLLWGFQMAFFMVSLFFLLSMYLLATSKGTGWRFALSVASAVVCAFSMAHGLLAWPIGLLLILWMRQSQPRDLRRPYLGMLCVWCLASVLVFVSYFSGFHEPSRNTEFFIHHPYTCLKYFLASLGSLTIGTFWGTSASLPYPNHYGYVAIVVGLVLLPLYAFTCVTLVLRAKARPHAALTLSLILFALLSLALMTVEDSSSGISDALKSTHSTLPIMGVVGLYMAAISIETKHVCVRQFLVGFVTCLTILFVALSCGYGIKAGPDWKHVMDTQAYALSTCGVQSDETVRPLFPWDIRFAREQAAVLERHRLNVFSKPSLKLDELVPLAGATEGRADSINNVQMVEQYPAIVTVSSEDDTVTIRGWAIDKEAADTAGAVFINIGGETDVPAFYGMDRPDIAAHFGERCQASGFTASFATAIVPAGQPTLSLKVVTHDETGYYTLPLGIIIETG